MTGFGSIILWWMAAQKYCLCKYRDIFLWQWSKVQTVTSWFCRTQGVGNCLEKTIVSQLACPSSTPGGAWSQSFLQRHFPGQLNLPAMSGLVFFLHLTLSCTLASEIGSNVSCSNTFFSTVGLDKNLQWFYSIASYSFLIFKKRKRK